MPRNKFGCGQNEIFKITKGLTAKWVMNVHLSLKQEFCLSGYQSVCSQLNVIVIHRALLIAGLKTVLLCIAFNKKCDNNSNLCNDP